MDLESLRAAVERGESFEYLFFWGHRPRKDHKLGPSCLSQWWRCAFDLDGQRYSSAEQYMMAEKARLSGDAEALAVILSADEPGRIKALGRQVRGFDEARWTAARFDIVVRGSTAKFGQDEHLRRYLLGTRESVLVEASPTDRIWGIGLAADDPRARDPHAWLGENLLGFALMRARESLR
jgi:ribA/ribD-fused uncharacterized protein